MEDVRSVVVFIIFAVIVKLLTGKSIAFFVGKGDNEDEYAKLEKAYKELEAKVNSRLDTIEVNVADTKKTVEHSQREKLRSALLEQIEIKQKVADKLNGGNNNGTD